MKRKLFSLLLMLCLVTAWTVPALADTVYGKPDWKVTFTKDNKMESSFTAAELRDAVYSMQPGDTAEITLALENANVSATDWYMTNKVLSSLEEGSVGNGGAYTYNLTYYDKAGTATVLFSSDTVGGDSATGGVGLHSATGALEDYFYLDTLKSGEKGSIKLEVGLNGETQGNNYQNTLANLQMNFAVELNSTGTPPTNNTPQGTGKVVKTGDETDLTPFVLTATVSGTLFLILCVYGRKARKKELEKEAQ